MRAHARAPGVGGGGGLRVLPQPQAGREVSLEGETEEGGLFPKGARAGLTHPRLGGAAGAAPPVRGSVALVAVASVARPPRVNRVSRPAATTPRFRTQMSGPAPPFTTTTRGGGGGAAEEGDDNTLPPPGRAPHCACPIRPPTGRPSPPPSLQSAHSTRQRRRR